MAKRITTNELSEKLNVLAYNINHIKMLLDNLGMATSKYIDFKGDTEDFKKHLESMQNVDKLKESVNNDTKWYEYYR